MVSLLLWVTFPGTMGSGIYSQSTEDRPKKQVAPSLASWSAELIGLTYRGVLSMSEKSSFPTTVWFL